MTNHRIGEMFGSSFWDVSGALHSLEKCCGLLEFHLLFRCTSSLRACTNREGIRHVVNNPYPFINPQANFSRKSSVHQATKRKRAMPGCRQVLLHKRTEEPTIFLANPMSVNKEATVSLSVKDRTGHALYTTSSSTMTPRNSRRSPNVGNVSNRKWFSTFGDPDPSSLALFGDKVA